MLLSYKKFIYISFLKQTKKLIKMGAMGRSLFYFRLLLLLLVRFLVLLLFLLFPLLLVRLLDPPFLGL